MLEHEADSNPPQNLSFNRRSALGVLGGSSLAMIASSLPASAFFSRGTAVEPVDFSGLPAEWVRIQGDNLKGYANFLNSLKLKKLSPEQIIEAHAKRRGSVWNMLPPKALWKNNARTFKVIDRVAIEMNQPVKEVVSAYRSPAYNARCPGASRGSWHQANVAVDVQFHTRASSVAAVTRNLRARGLFKGGVGRYSSFTHIDTRGQNFDW